MIIISSQFISLLAQLVEHCTGLEVMSSLQAWIFFSGLIFIPDQVVFVTGRSLLYSLLNPYTVLIYDFPTFTNIITYLHICFRGSMACLLKNELLQRWNRRPLKVTYRHLQFFTDFCYLFIWVCTLYKRRYDLYL